MTIRRVPRGNHTVDSTVQLHWFSLTRLPWCAKCWNNIIIQGPHENKPWGQQSKSKQLLFLRSDWRLWSNLLAGASCCSCEVGNFANISNKRVDMSTREYHRYRWWIGRGSRTTLSACVMVAFLRVRVHRMLLRVAFVTNWSSNWRHYILIARTQMNSSIIMKQCGMNAEDTRNWEVKFVHSQNESGSYKSCIPPGCMLEHTFFEDWTVLAAMLLANMLTNNSPRAMSRGMGSQGPGDGCD